MTDQNCHCRKFTMTDAVIKPAPLKYQEYVDEKLGYYCGSCDGFHHVKQEEVSVVRGPVNARALLSASGKLDGQHIIRWSIGSSDDSVREIVETVEFFPWPRRYPMTETEPLIHLTWKLLMSKMPTIMEKLPPLDPSDDELVLRHVNQIASKNEARGIADVLAIQMKPFMESADHVVRCAVAAYKDPEFAVPGLGSHLWDPMKNPDGSDRVPISTPRSANKTAPKARPKVNNKSTKKLTDKEAEGIREAVSSGMFTKEDVASMFDVSLAEIEAALGVEV